MIEHPELGAAQIAPWECTVIRGPVVPGAPLVTVELLLPYRARAYPDDAAYRRPPARWSAGECVTVPEPEALALVRAGIANPHREGNA